jgi:hypothetical protein
LATDFAFTPISLDIDVPVDIADGDTVLWLVFGQGNARLDDPSTVVDPPGSWDPAEYDYWTDSNGLHVFTRLWKTGDEATTETFSVAGNTGSGVNGAALAWDAIDVTAHGSGPTTTAAIGVFAGVPENIVADGVFGEDEILGLVVTANHTPGDDPIITVNAAGLSPDFSFTHVDPGFSGTVNAYIGLGDGSMPNLYDWDLDVDSGATYFNVIELTQKEQAPARGAADPANVNPDYVSNYDRRRARSKALPFYLDTSWFKGV